MNVPAEVRAEAIAIRRDLHRHPELGYRETRTAAIIATYLRAISIEVHEGIATTGVVGVVRGLRPGRTIMLRADMDALPMQDQKEVDYRSSVPNVMHACGHDGHVATLLAAARLIMERRDEIAGTIVLCFQPAEEGLGGARAMLQERLLERFGIDRAYGLHYFAHYPTGVVATRRGALMASSDLFDVEIVGRGGHASVPHQAIDPIAAAGQTIVALNQIVSRRIDPIEPAVISVCSVHGGTNYNVIPSSAHLKGTIRAFSEDVRTALKSHVNDVCAHTSSAVGAIATVSHPSAHGGYPVTINDAGQADYVSALAADLLGAGRSIVSPPMLAGEDFSLFAQQVPSCFFFVGSNGSPATAFMNHHERFDLDERALETGIAMMATIARDAPRNAP